MCQKGLYGGGGLWKEAWGRNGSGNESNKNTHTRTHTLSSYTHINPHAHCILMLEKWFLICHLSKVGAINCYLWGYCFAKWAMRDTATSTSPQLPPEEISLSLDDGWWNAGRMVARRGARSLPRTPRACLSPEWNQCCTVILIHIFFTCVSYFSLLFCPCSLKSKLTFRQISIAFDAIKNMWLKWFRAGGERRTDFTLIGTISN